MKKAILTLYFLLFVISNSLMAQTGIHFGLKAGYNLATQYGIKDPNKLYAGRKIKIPTQ